MRSPIGWPPGFWYWAAGPAQIISRLIVAKQNSDQCSGALGQRMLEESGRGRHMERQLVASRALHARRAYLTGQALAAHMPAGTTWTTPDGGCYIWLTLTPVEFLPRIGFRPVLGQRVMTNFVTFEPGAEAPRHVQEEEHIVIVLDGEFTFDLDGDVRVLRKGDVALVPSWVPHGAWTTDSHCLEIDVFSPPRQSLLKLAAAQAAAAAGSSGTAPGTGSEA